MENVTPAEQTVYETFGEQDWDRTRYILRTVRPHLYREAAERLLDRVPPVTAGPRTQQERGFVDAAKVLRELADEIDSFNHAEEVVCGDTVEHDLRDGETECVRCGAEIREDTT